MPDAPPLPPVIGHRGIPGCAPENTLAGFRAAARSGVRWVEFDVHLSADGVPVLMHDHTLDRTTDGTGPVDGQNLAELRTLDAGSWFDDRFAGETIPTLEDTFRLLTTLGMGANVELKPAPGREVATGHAVGRVLAHAGSGALPPVLVSSFAEASLAAARAAAPGIARGLLRRTVAGNWAETMRALGCATMHCRHQNLTRSLAAEIRGAGYPLLAYTVNDRRRARTLLDWGAVSVITDRPAQLLGL